MLTVVMPVKIMCTIQPSLRYYYGQYSNKPRIYVLPVWDVPCTGLPNLHEIHT